MPSTLTVTNTNDTSSVTGNSIGGHADDLGLDVGDVGNFGVLYRDGTSTIGYFYGNAAIPI